MILLPIFSKTEQAGPVYNTQTPATAPASQHEEHKPSAKDQVTHRPTTRRVSGREVVATPSITSALRDEPSFREKDSSYNQDKASSSTESKNQSFTKEELIKVWKVFVDKIDSPQLKSALSTREPDIKDQWNVEYILDNELQSRRLTDDLKPKLLGYLRRQLNNGLIEINFLISAHQDHSPAQPYTDSEKWQALVEKYPALALLKSKFGLDLE